MQARVRGAAAIGRSQMTGNIKPTSQILESPKATESAVKMLPKHKYHKPHGSASYVRDDSAFLWEQVILDLP